MTAALNVKAPSPAQYRKNIIRLLKENSHRHHIWEVFSDFCEMAALAISNSVDLRQYGPREARYLQIVERYEPLEIERFTHILGELTMAMECGPDDVIGKVFGELDLGNSARGQFFTPYHVCKLMAAQLIGDGSDLRTRIAERGFIRVSEPAVGAGAMIISMAESVQAAGVNYQQCMHVTAQDVDSRAVHMAYLQFSLLHIPAVVILGNTLALEEREHWYTPAHVIGFWNGKLNRGYSLGSKLDEMSAISDELQAPLPGSGLVPNQRQGEQISLF